MKRKSSGLLGTPARSTRAQTRAQTAAAVSTPDQTPTVSQESQTGARSSWKSASVISQESHTATAASEKPTPSASQQSQTVSQKSEATPVSLESDVSTTRDPSLPPWSPEPEPEHEVSQVIRPTFSNPFILGREPEAWETPTTSGNDPVQQWRQAQANFQGSVVPPQPEQEDSQLVRPTFSNPFILPRAPQALERPTPSSNDPVQQRRHAQANVQGRIVPPQPEQEVSQVIRPTSPNPSTPGRAPQAWETPTPCVNDHVQQGRQAQPHVQGRVVPPQPRQTYYGSARTPGVASPFQPVSHNNEGARTRVAAVPLWQPPLYRGDSMAPDPPRPTQPPHRGQPYSHMGSVRGWARLLAPPAHTRQQTSSLYPPPRPVHTPFRPTSTHQFFQPAPAPQYTYLTPVQQYSQLHANEITPRSRQTAPPAPPAREHESILARRTALASTVSPHYSIYPLHRDKTLVASKYTDNFALQGQFPPFLLPGNPVFLYFGRDISDPRNKLPMTVDGRILFERKTEGDRSDHGYGIGVRVAGWARQAAGEAEKRSMGYYLEVMSEAEKEK